MHDLVKTNNKWFNDIKRGVTDKELKYLTICSKRANNLGKICLLPMIQKLLSRFTKVPGRPVVSNWGAPTKSVSEFLNSELKFVVEEGCSYIKDFDSFYTKLKNIDHTPQGAIRYHCLI